jgi:hypothetical protein
MELREISLYVAAHHGYGRGAFWVSEGPINERTEREADVTWNPSTLTFSIAWSGGGPISIEDTSWLACKCGLKHCSHVSVSIPQAR